MYGKNYARNQLMNFDNKLSKFFFIFKTSNQQFNNEKVTEIIKLNEKILNNHDVFMQFYCAINFVMLFLINK